MKYFLFVFCSFFSYANAYSIVFVHIGPNLPSYTLLALRQARLFNPGCSIVLLAEELATSFYEEELTTLQVVTVALQSLTPSQEHQEFCKRNHWKDFWKFTTERFFYLDEWMKKENVNDLFHLENDNLLYIDLEELLPLFHKHYPGMGVTFINDRQGAAGFLYIAHREALHRFTQFIANSWIRGKKITDMQLLVEFQKKKKRSSLYLSSCLFILECFLSKILKEKSQNIQTRTQITARNFSLFLTQLRGETILNLLSPTARLSLIPLSSSMNGEETRREEEYLSSH